MIDQDSRRANNDLSDGPWPAQRVEVVTVTYNSEAVLVDCLTSVPPGVRVWVVDNASTDRSGALAAGFSEHVKLVALDQNLGYGTANNAALREIAADYALLLNPDARLPPGTLEGLVQVADANPDYAILAPRQVDQAPQGALARDEILEITERPEVSAAVMLLRLSVFRRIGYFDERIFMYSEDNELCQRARLAGARVGMVRALAAVHFGNRSTPYSDRAQFRKWVMSGRSFSYIARKHNNHVDYAIFVIRKLCLYTVGALSSALRLDKEQLLRNGGRACGIVLFLLTNRTN